MLLSLLVLACGGSPSEVTGDPVAGESTYTGACAPCHGPDGTLGIPVGGPPASSLPDVVPALSDNELADVIQNGIRTMPSTTLDEQETADVIAYVREQWP